MEASILKHDVKTRVPPQTQVRVTRVMRVVTRTLWTLRCRFRGDTSGLSRVTMYFTTALRFRLLGKLGKLGKVLRP